MTRRGAVAKRLTLVSLVEAKHVRGEPGYPERLGRVERCPEAVYLRGRWVERPLAVAIVGSRGASRAGVEQARELATELGSHSAQIVSGGALGIDAAAHRGALAAGAHTAAVLASGLDNPYPARNRPLFEEIEEAGGALLSPYESGRPPRGFQFVRRNHVMAQMVDAVVLVDCRQGSGAMHTAEAAWKAGRAVAAYPGSPGCEALLAQGAAVVQCAADVRAAIEGRPRALEVALPPEGTDLRAALFALAGEEPRDAGRISAITGLSIRGATRALAQLELEGLAVAAPGSAYLRSEVARGALGIGAAAREGPIE